MPRRSNPFQKLIHLIHHQVADGAKIVESKLLKDLITGEEREVDVVIETSVGSHTVIIGIECTSCKRRPDVTWVEQMWAKHQKLPTDKLVLVSKSGFTKKAIREANSRGIKAISFIEAVSADWTSIVNKTKELFLIIVDTTPKSVEIIYFVNETKEAQKCTAGPEQLLFDEAGQAQATMKQIVFSIIGQRFTTKMILENACRNRDLTLTASYLVPEGWYVVDRNGSIHLVRELRFHCECKRRVETSIKLSAGLFGSIPICYGDILSSSMNGIFSLVQEKDKLPKYSIIINKGGEGDSQIIDLLPFNSNSITR